MVKSDLWLIGASNIAIEYLNVLEALNISSTVICRSKSSSEKFYSITGKRPINGGLSDILKRSKPPQKAIVTVSVDQLYDCTKLLVENGCKHILVEKPGALNIIELKNLMNIKKRFNTNLWIAYNRRFYQSVQLLKELVKADNGIKSLCFEFTELGSVFDNPVHSNEIKERMLVCNSSHVIDLAFYLIGEPKPNNWNCFHSGKLPNHNSSSRFHGAGISVKNIPFSYFSDWECPGRWGLEIMTTNNRFILKPLEKLQRIPKGKFEADFVDLPERIESRFKPGFYSQCHSFLLGDQSNLKTLEEQIHSFNIYNLMAGY